MNKKTLTYDDIQLIPRYSEIKSRQDISLKTKLSRNYDILIPLVASPMDTICDSEMAIKMFELGGVGCIHRFMSIEEQVKHVSLVTAHAGNALQYGISIWGMGEYGTPPIMAAIGVGKDDLKRASELARVGANVLLIDVAHGFHKNVADMLEKLKKLLPKDVDIIAGNVASYKATQYLINHGADGIRVGIGGGSLCTTRIKTGFGIPNVSSIENCSYASDVPIMADGGLRTSGDIAKALAVGASNVMLGSMLAGTEETPGKIIERPDGLFKRYRGSASLETKATHGQEQRNVEGESTVVPFKGGVRFVVNGILDGIRSALSYAGATNLDEYHPEYTVVTNSGAKEASPHLL